LSSDFKYFEEPEEKEEEGEAEEQATEDLCSGRKEEGTLREANETFLDLSRKRRRKGKKGRKKRRKERRKEGVRKKG
jgi:hypothetical protein